MMNKIKRYTLVFLVSFQFLFGCEDLEVFEDCNMQPQFDIEIPPDCVPPCTVRFINLSSGRIDSYRWNFDNGETGVEVENPDTITYDTDGNYTAVLTVSAFGCDPIDLQMTFTVGVAPPIADFTLSRERCTLVAEDCLFEFTNTSDNADSIQWFVDDIPAGNAEILTRTFTEPDTHFIRLQAHNAGMETNDISAEVVIRPLTFDVALIDMDGDPDQADVVYGIDEATNGEYYLIANNGNSTFLAKTDVFGEVIDGPKNHPFPDDPYDDLQVQSFAKTPTGYLLAGKAIKNGIPVETDMFVFKASTTLNFFGYEAYSRPFATDEEIAFAIASQNNGSSYLLGGSGNFLGDQPGMYILQLDQALEPISPQHHLLELDENAVVKAIWEASNGQLWVAGNIDANTTVFTVLSDNFEPIGTPLSIGTNQFLIDQIIGIDSETAIVLGTSGGGGSQAVQVIVDQAGNAAIGWSQPYSEGVFRSAILDAEGRLFLLGRETDTGLPALCTVDLETGLLQSNAWKRYSGSQIEEGDLFAGVVTADGGLLLGGRGRGNNTDYQSILIKTDRNGTVD